MGNVELIKEFCIKPDGSVEIPINPEGLPSVIGIMPTICYKPEERLKMVEAVIDGCALRGYWVDSWKWIRNPVFDKNGEKTSVEIKYRVCKNNDEALILVEKIKEIVKRLEDA